MQLHRYNTAFVLGKFCPLHLGHEYLINTAINGADRLYIVVDNIMDEVIPVKQRMQWVHERYPEAVVLTQPHPLPQSPEEAQDFWDIWRTVLMQILPEPIEAVFASELYGERLAQELGAEYVAVDIGRSHIPISATDIRQDYCAYWHFISGVAQPWYMRKICVFGPESTGKSTLTAQLAEYYGGAKVDEYALDVIVTKSGDIKYSDMSQIVEGHHRRLQEAYSHPVPYLFVDTDAIASKIWSKVLFGKELPDIDRYIAAQHFDLYLLLDIDLPWHADIHRYCPDNRQEFFDLCLRELDHYGPPYAIISGLGEERLKNAIAAIDKWYMTTH